MYTVLVFLVLGRSFHNVQFCSASGPMYQRIRFLQSVPLLKNYPGNLFSLANSFHQKFYSKGQYIVEEGKEGTNFYIIVKGSAKITKGNGAFEFTLGKLHSTDYFGERSLLKTGDITANVIAMESGVTVLEIDKSRFQHLLGSISELHNRRYYDEL